MNPSLGQALCACHGLTSASCLIFSAAAAGADAASDTMIRPNVVYPDTPLPRGFGHARGAAAGLCWHLSLALHVTDMLSLGSCLP